MTDQTQPQITQAQLDNLQELGKKYLELKAFFLKLNLSSQENVRLAIERFDDGFLRAREAIFSAPIVNEFEDEKVANDSTAPDETPLAASHQEIVMKKEKKGMKMDKDDGKKELKKEAPKKQKGEMKNADMGKEYSKYKKMKKQY